MALGLLPDVEYSVENGRTDGQWSDVTGWDGFFYIGLQDGRDDGDSDNGLRDSGLGVERPAVPYKRVTGLRVCGASRYYRRIVQVSYGLV